MEEYKELLLVLLGSMLSVSVAITVWKKNIRKTAKAFEIKSLAAILSILITVSLGLGLQLIGIPLGLIAYTLIVFFGQWLFSQKVLDEIWIYVMKYLKKKFPTED